MHSGVAVGPDFCGPESPALRVPNIWVVSIGKLKYHLPTITKVNIKYSRACPGWSLCEAATSLVPNSTAILQLYIVPV